MALDTGNFEIFNNFNANATDRIVSGYRSHALLCDVTFVVGDKQYPAHKFIVAVASPVLLAAFQSNV